MPVTRNILVCLRNKCWQCPYVKTVVPDDCPFDILHVVDVEAGFHVMPRRSGKTTKLIQIANQLADMGALVTFVSKYPHGLGMVRSGLDPKVRMVSIQNKTSLRGRSGFAVCDELQQDEVDDVKSAGLQVVAAYRT